MAEYIGREAAKKEFALNFGSVSHAVIANRLLDSIPTADVAPVVHGRWIHAKTYYELDECNCSLCGQLMTTEIDKRMNYCPDCGARMDGE